MSDSNLSVPKRFPWRRTLAIVVIIIVTMVISMILIFTGPKATRKTPEPMQANVKVRSLERTDSQVVIEAMGSVIPQQSIDLSTQVSGEVVELGPRFSEGHLLEKGALILRIDDRDYQTALQSAQAQLDQMSSDRAIESGYQSIAKREWELIQEAQAVAGVDSSLALREPQLKAAEAQVAMAQAALEETQLDLERTRLVAPFNAIVLEKSVDLGSYLAPQTTVASLAGTDTYWVRVAVPKSELSWLLLPGPQQPEGSVARVYPAGKTGDYREGHVVVLLGDLDTAGRMARVLVAIDDPLALLPENADKSPLLLGDYVRVELVGRELKDVFSLPRESFRDGARVWLANENDKLEIREVTPLWKGTDQVIVRDGLEEDERLVVSNLSMTTPGLQLIVADEAGNPMPATQPKVDAEKVQ